MVVLGIFLAFLGREAEELPPDAFDDAGKIKAETGPVDVEDCA